MPRQINASTKRKRKVLTCLLGVLVLLTSFIAYYVWHYGELILTGVESRPFDAAAWRQPKPIDNDRTERSQMVDDLLRRYDFSGWTREEVVKLLGEPDAISGEGMFPEWDMTYLIGLERGGSWSLDYEYLVFRLDKNNRVVDYRKYID